jgi:Cytochrome C oxidase, cbb3-type, subunit III
VRRIFLCTVPDLAQHLRCLRDRFRLAWEQVTSTPAEDLNNIITNGKHHMPKFGGKLTADEIQTLVQQIKTSNKK